ncbi:MAG TPA: hypothetical protein VJ901_09095 [Thermoanaerobaculia bacterium]|nr:hypothetical protein [Thermoanaerobaculia bacterium]
MTRKPLALAIVLLIAGLTPATAIIGFCTRMPCCNHDAAAVLAASNANDCCTTITCYETPSAKLAPGTSAQVSIAAPVAVRVAFVNVQPRSARKHVDTSPPLETRHRLAILSTLLI